MSRLAQQVFDYLESRRGRALPKSADSAPLLLCAPCLTMQEKGTPAVTILHGRAICIDHVGWGAERLLEDDTRPAGSKLEVVPDGTPTTEDDDWSAPTSAPDLDAGAAVHCQHPSCIEIFDSATAATDHFDRVHAGAGR